MNSTFWVHSCCYILTKTYLYNFLLILIKSIIFILIKTTIMIPINLSRYNRLSINISYRRFTGRDPRGCWGGSRLYELGCVLVTSVFVCFICVSYSVQVPESVFVSASIASFDWAIPDPLPIARDHNPCNEVMDVLLHGSILVSGSPNMHVAASRK